MRPESKVPARLLGVEGDLLRAARAAELVDAGVARDLVDPRLEGDRALGGAHAAQRGDEDLLDEVLGTAVVLDHAEDVGGDAALVAAVELLEGAVVAAADRRDQLARRPCRTSEAIPATVMVSHPRTSRPTTARPRGYRALLMSEP